MKQFKPGARVRVEQDARIVQLNEKNNPYWYIVEFPDGRRDLVSIARITHLADEPIIAQDSDGSIQIISNRLTPAGVRNLIEKLQARAEYFPDVSQEEEQAIEESEV